MAYLMHSGAWILNLMMCQAAREGSEDLMSILQL